MGRLFIETLTGPKIFKCRCCKVDSASHNDIVSKDFNGRFGRAYLFRNVLVLCSPIIIIFSSLIISPSFYLKIALYLMVSPFTLATVLRWVFMCCVCGLWVPLLFFWLSVVFDGIAIHKIYNFQLHFCNCAVMGTYVMCMGIMGLLSFLAFFGIFDSGVETFVKSPGSCPPNKLCVDCSLSLLH